MVNSTPSPLQNLQQAGLRLTPQREAIYALLTETDSHPTAAEIYEILKPRFASLSLATVYNTLETLVNLGIINALGGAGDSQTHYDADTSPHVNLACLACNTIVDIPSTLVQEIHQEVSQNSGFKVLGARVLYYGLCPTCQAKETTPNR
jgi:Fur family peroxide stress response transcriptional regulator